MEKLLDRLIDFAAVVARVSAWIGGALLTLSAIVIGIDILLRNTVAITIGGANELSGYALAVATPWAMILAMLHRSHVRIDTVYTHLSSWWRAFLDLVGLAATISFFALVAWYAEGVLEQSIDSNTHSVSALAIPLAIPQALWFAGFVVFLVVAAILLLRAILAFAKGDLRRVHALVGARSTEEELEAEQQSLAALKDTARPAMKGSAT
ncbi:MAG TPA: TRAP transporter small permease [Pseudorhodoplanes sp.]|nr:TRAP transporter small permease [Pseudorhodoplanes sp.]